jgi:hypothetical protein
MSRACVKLKGNNYFDYYKILLDNPINSSESIEEDTNKAKSTEKGNINIVQVETETINQTILTTNSFNNNYDESEKEVGEKKL